MVVEFSEFELDLERYELRRGGTLVRLQPKVFDLLAYLVEHRERVVGKDELLLALWRGEHVNKTAVPWAMSRARKALGQPQDASAPIETVRGRGYRFVAPVRAVAEAIAEKEASTSGALVSHSAEPAQDPFVG